MMGERTEGFEMTWIRKISAILRLSGKGKNHRDKMRCPGFRAPRSSIRRDSLEIITIQPRDEDLKGGAAQHR